MIIGTPGVSDEEFFDFSDCADRCVKFQRPKVLENQQHML